MFGSLWSSSNAFALPGMSYSEVSDFYNDHPYIERDLTVNEKDFILGYKFLEPDLVLQVNTDFQFGFAVDSLILLKMSSEAEWGLCKNNSEYGKLSCGATTGNSLDIWHRNSEQAISILKNTYSSGIANDFKSSKLVFKNETNRIYLGEGYVYRWAKIDAGSEMIDDFFILDKDKLSLAINSSK